MRRVLKLVALPILVVVSLAIAVHLVVEFDKDGTLSTSTNVPSREASYHTTANPFDRQAERIKLVQSLQPPVAPHEHLYKTAVFGLVAYGNPYKAVIDARDLPAAARDSVYVSAHLLCAEVHQLWLGEHQAGASKGDVAGNATAQQALLTLQAQCTPIWQDDGVFTKLWRANASMSKLRASQALARSRGDSVSAMPLEAWREMLLSKQSTDDGSWEARHFRGELWGGLENQDQYARAVQQAMLNITISPHASSPHAASLIHCAATGACQIPANRLAVYDLPVEAQGKVLAQAQHIQMEIMAGNYKAFESPGLQR